MDRARGACEVGIAGLERGEDALVLGLGLVAGAPLVDRVPTRARIVGPERVSSSDASAGLPAARAIAAWNAASVATSG